MKYWMILALATMAMLIGCNFGYTPPSKANDAYDNLLADSQDAYDGEVDDEVKFNPPLPIDTEPQAADTDVASADNDDTVNDDDGDVNHPLSETDTGADEIIQPEDTEDTDESETIDAPSVDADVNSDLDTKNVAEPKADAPDAQDAEAETSLPCIPNCAGKQCGDDDCDGSCGICSDGFTCNADFVCECVVGCQILAEPPIADATDAHNAVDTTTTDTADVVDAAAQVDTIQPPKPDAMIVLDMASSIDTITPNQDTTPVGQDTTPSVDIVQVCVPDCAGKQCGDDGCGSECGVCASNACLKSICVNGACENTPINCNDGNICTTDSCNQTSGCVHINNTASCDDGNQCTANDACKNSVCAPGKPIVCDDNDACTDDYCTNGIGCVYEWQCKCTIDAECDDLNPCTDDACTAGFCEYAFNSAPCDNSDACTAVDQCVSGECLGIVPFNCNDGNECTVDTCNPQSGCQNEPQTGMACNDGNACTTADACNKDVCAGKAIVCNDQNPCTDDSCNEQNGCVYTFNNANPCEDGSLCTTGDFCDAGQCHGGDALKCDDLNLCTDNVCQPQKGCVYLANQAGCDDGNSCTVGDICADTACKSGTNICQCAADADCAKAEDNNLCNGTLVCDKSVMPFQCVVDIDTVITCPATSDTACLKNTCQPQSGKCEMKMVNEGGSCDDTNACTSNDQCASSICSGASIKCDDSNVCTDDSCNPTSGCVFTNNAADCDDGTVCTLVDICQNSKCVGTAFLDCDDDDQCTLDVCNKTLGCQHSKTAMNNKSCDNGDACTVSDTCQNGVCQAGTQTCECYTTTDCAGKEDGNLCNGTLTCNTAIMPHKCALDPATIIICPTTSDTTCSKNTCQPVSGKCEMTAVNEGVGCDDGNPCTTAEQCMAGACVGTPKPTGTVIFADDFDDGNLDGWAVKTWNSCPNCSMCPCDLPLATVSGQSPFWVKMAPLAGSGHILFTSPATFLPKGGSIKFLFAGANCGGTTSKCEVTTSAGSLGKTDNLGCTAPPPACLQQFSITKDEQAGQVMLECVGASSDSYTACGATYIDDFSITCP